MMRLFQGVNASRPELRRYLRAQAEVYYGPGEPPHQRRRDPQWITTSTQPWTKEGDEEESIGEIKPSNLILSSTGKSIPRDIKEEDIADYVQAGDKLTCRVVKSMSMRSFSYVEEEEEIGEDGEEKRTSRTVEIKPQWIAISGETLVQVS